MSKTVDKAGHLWEESNVRAKNRIGQLSWDEEYIAARNTVVSIVMILVSFAVFRFILGSSDAPIAKGLFLLLDFLTKLVIALIEKTLVYFLFPFVLYIAIRLFTEKDSIRLALGFLVVLIAIFFFVPDLALDTNGLVASVKETLPDNLKNTDDKSIYDVFVSYVTHPSNFGKLIIETVSGSVKMVFGLMWGYFIWASQVVVLSLTNLPQAFGVFICAIFSFLLTGIVSIACSGITLIPGVGDSFTEIVEQVGNYTVFIYVFGYLFLVSALIKGVGNLVVLYVRKHRKMSAPDIDLISSNNTDEAPSITLPSTKNNLEELDSNGSQSNEQKSSQGNFAFERKFLIGLILAICLVSAFFGFQRFQRYSEIENMKNSIEEVYGLFQKYELHKIIEKTDTIISKIENDDRMAAMFKDDLQKIVRLNQWAKNPTLTLVSWKSEVSPNAAEKVKDPVVWPAPDLMALPDQKITIYPGENSKQYVLEKVEDQMETPEIGLEKPVSIYIKHIKVRLVDDDGFTSREDLIGESEARDAESLLKEAGSDGNRLYANFLIKNEDGTENGSMVTLFFKKPNLEDIP